MAWPRQASPSELYKEFIQEASKCYADALEHEKPDVPLLVVLYGKISRMRVISSPQVLAAAEQVLRRIVDVYFEPPIVFSTAQVQFDAPRRIGRRPSELQPTL